MVTRENTARRCAAKSKRSGLQCNLSAAVGLDKCYLHAGVNRSKRLEAKGEAELSRQLAKLDLDPVDNPLQELALVSAQVIWFKDQVAARVNELTSLRYSVENGEQLRAEVSLFERALDRCEKFLGTMTRLNIDQRLAVIEEQQAELIAKTLAMVLAELGLDLTAQNSAKVKVVQRLRAIESA